MNNLPISPVDPAAMDQLGVKRFDVVDYLDSEEVISEYLTAVLEEGDSDELLRALGHIAKARGMSDIAAKSGLGRESLYKALSPGAKPRFDTVLRVIHALGIRLQAHV
jgi:probable addiction module antidote protein